MTRQYFALPSKSRGFTCSLEESRMMQKGTYSSLLSLLLLLLHCLLFYYLTFCNRENVLETGRDVFNEKPSKDEHHAISQPASRALGKGAIIHTTMGDILLTPFSLPIPSSQKGNDGRLHIHIKLFPEETPKSIENFTTHSRNGYYNGIIFHRVIQGFMIQTGDPLGDGTGGTSIWGHDFEGMKRQEKGRGKERGKEEQKERGGWKSTSRVVLYLFIIY